MDSGADRRLQAHEPSSLDWLTVERALYGLCVLTAAALRFHGLGRDPLGPGEAAAVWPAWVAATAGDGSLLPTAQPPTSALLFSLHWLLFWLTGAAGEALVRWPAAAMGTGLVLLPWALRPVVGRTAALMFAALLATDPLLVKLSRTANGESVTAFCGLLALVSLARHGRWGGEQTGSEWRHRVREILPAIALGLLLVSGAQAWSLLILLGVGIAVFPSIRPRAGNPLVGAAGIVVGTGALAATAGFAQWEGPALVSVSLGAWIRAWATSVNPVAALAGLVAGMVRGQPLLIVLPLIGLVSVWCRDRPSRRCLRAPALAVMVAAALAVGQAETVAGPLALGMTLAMLAAYEADRLATRVTELLRRNGRAGGAAAGWVVIIVVGFLVFSTLRAGVDGYPTRVPLADGIRLLSRDVAAMCAGRGEGPSACRIDIIASPWPDPLLGWYLREVAPIRFVLSPALEDQDGTHRLIVSRAAAESSAGDDPPLALPAHYVGSEYRTGDSARAGGRVVLWVPGEQPWR